MTGTAAARGRGAGRGSAARVGLALALLACSSGWGCQAPPWDAESLAARHPELRRHPGQRLADVRPYYLPLDGELTLLLCRWPRERPIPVRVLGDATPDERQRLEAALRAWEGAGLGVRFERVERLVGAGIRVEFVDAMRASASSTQTECAVDLGARSRPRGPLAAQLVSAWVELGRDDPHPLGSALHELGHALGFQGHPRRGRSVMLRDRRLLLDHHLRLGRGEPFADPTLAALYALPSGTVLARLALGHERTRAVDRLAALAGAHGWRGPRLQVGDDAGRVDWRVPGEGRVGVVVEGLRAALDDPTRLRVEPLETARPWLE